MFRKQTGPARLTKRMDPLSGEGMENDSVRPIVELVRRVRHDANGPLTVALGHVHLLLEDSGRLDPDVVDTLKIVETELRRLIKIMRGLDGLRSQDERPGKP
jgi:signal transduction histidine kinase